MQLNFLMAVMEIAAVAECNPDDLQKVSFESHSFSVKNCSGSISVWDSSLQIPAITSIGSLAGNLSGKFSHSLCPLVTQLGDRNIDGAMGSAIAWGEFTCPEN